MKYPVFRIAVFMFVLFTRLTLFAQDREAGIKDWIAARNYVFIAQSAQPASGGSRFLTADYDLRVSKDSLVSYLPYFGRAYGMIDPNDSGIRFTSTDFGYAVKEKKKGWEITLTPKDTREVRQLFLFVSKSGSASLQVLNNNRQPISFSGYVAQRSK